MEKKQVIIISLLLIAIVLSSASVLMNFSAINDIEFTEAAAEPENPDISLTISPRDSIPGGPAG